jgi:hypothetical protein
MRGNARLAQHVRESRRTLVELGVRQPLLTRDHRDARRDGVGDTLEEISEVELHEVVLQTRNYSLILT